MCGLLSRNEVLYTNALLPKANKQMHDHHHLDNAMISNQNAPNVYICKVYKNTLYLWFYLASNLI